MRGQATTSSIAGTQRMSTSDITTPWWNRASCVHSSSENGVTRTTIVYARGLQVQMSFAQASMHEYRLVLHVNRSFILVFSLGHVAVCRYAMRTERKEGVAPNLHFYVVTRSLLAACYLMERSFSDHKGAPIRLQVKIRLTAEDNKLYESQSVSAFLVAEPCSWSHVTPIALSVTLSPQHSAWSLARSCRRVTMYFVLLFTSHEYCLHPTHNAYRPVRWLAFADVHS